MRGPVLSSLGVRPPLWREARIGLEAAALVRDPIFRGDGVADGRGRPVLLIPGFLAGDGSLSMMAGWLKRTGYRPSRAGIVSNVNCAGVLLPRLEQRLERLVELQGQPAAIVGQSRGGTLAKVLAYRRPELVSRRRGARLAAGGPAGGASARPAPGGGGRAGSGRSARPGLFKRSCLDGECCSAFWQDLGRAAAARRAARVASTRRATASWTGAPASTRTRPSWSRSGPRTAGWPSRARRGGRWRTRSRASARPSSRAAGAARAGAPAAARRLGAPLPRGAPGDRAGVAGADPLAVAAPADHAVQLEGAARAAAAEAAAELPRVALHDLASPSG